MDIDKRRFKKMFPHLAREMEGGEDRISIESIRSDLETGEKAASGQFDGYDPDVVDFLRRCDNEKQAEEIIEYLERKREVSHEHANRLRKQLKERGVRSFGPKKENDYYLRKAGL
jgi:hypothetical protein